MAYKPSRILEILSDGKWHEADQLRSSMDLTDCEINEIAEFLRKYDFAEIDDEKNRIKVNRDFKRILTQTSDTGNPSAVTRFSEFFAIQEMASEKMGRIARTLEFPVMLVIMVLSYGTFAGLVITFQPTPSYFVIMVSLAFAGVSSFKRYWNICQTSRFRFFH
jgi:hypothetical protein